MKKQSGMIETIIIIGTEHIGKLNQMKITW